MYSLVFSWSKLKLGVLKSTYQAIIIYICFLPGLAVDPWLTFVFQKREYVLKKWPFRVPICSRPTFSLLRVAIVLADQASHLLFYFRALHLHNLRDFVLRVVFFVAIFQSALLASYSTVQSLNSSINFIMVSLIQSNSLKRFSIIAQSHKNKEIHAKHNRLHLKHS